MVQTTQRTLRERIQLIEDAISSGKIEESMHECERILARYPNALEIQRLLGEVYLAQGRLEEAQQTFDSILINDPENVIVYCDRALICEHQSDIETALDCYQQAYELSRGNSQIRQEFNNLSARVGQQEFMLSRAGLARLYMRGHLYTQALQEWEAVLNASPERLDARLGYMETCWRDGHFEQVESMGARILEEVPECVKALLLLAHVTSAYNMQRARELIDRAVQLDPELLMAQDLFSEVSLSQPNDPFLKLIQREPIDLPGGEMNSNGKAIEHINTLQYASVDVEKEAAKEQSSGERLYHLNDISNWSELDTRSIPQTPVRGTPIVENGTAEQNKTATEPVAEQAQEEPIDDFETFVNEQEIDDDFDPALLEKQPWYQAEQVSEVEKVDDAGELEEADEESAGIDVAIAREADYMISEEELSPATEQTPDPWNAYLPQDDSWSSFTPKEGPDAPPAWLDMLTNYEQRPMPTSASAAPSWPASQVEADSEQEAPGKTPEFSRVKKPQDIPPFFISSGDTDDEDEDMSWPEWLKSLGAEALEPEASLPDADSTQSVSSSTWGPIVQEPSTPAPIASIAPLPPEPELPTDAEKEASLITTLESLEQQLRSQGFVPLQPGSLTAIAQEALPPSETSLSQVEQPTPPALPEIPETYSVAPWMVQPAWSAPVEQEAPPTLEAPQAKQTGELPAQDVAPALEAYPSEAAQADQPDIAVEDTVQSLGADRPAQAVVDPAPARSLDMLLDSELETTMRRPALRLQPLQDAPALPGRTTPPTAKSIDYSTKSSDSKLTNKERLVRGYQLQLAGAYDDAMQEYRTLIRNAPEVLGEVISNVRALLKLAPKFTAGYRVLGDAYMRQGEYLQAMEAYNKALTIAKKAKSPGR